jgi:glycosyltransferase involved in cell wall biosynthesis
MRILWLSNGPWCPSGYGEQTALFLPRLRDAGHELAVLCNYGLQGRETLFDGFTCYPSDGIWGNGNLATFAGLHEAELVVALCDAWVLHPDKWPETLPPVACWAPVDHYPIPPIVHKALEHERIRPVAMSRFGYEMMEGTGLDPVYVPHAVDPRVFRPRPELRDEVRDDLEIPRDVFLIGMVAANQSGPVSRKAFPQALHAFSLFARKHPGAWLYAHTQARPAGQGIQLDVLAEATGCPQGRLRFPHEQAFQIGMPARTVAAVYQALDVLLMPSMGEGFGVPLVEAQACGVPVIASDHSAMTELVGAGWLVGGEPWWDATQASFLINPSIARIVEALEHAYEARGDQGLRDQAVEFAARFHADDVTERYWLPALEQLASPRETVEAAA